MNTTQSNNEQAGVSRRNFIRLSMGAITLLPTVASEALLPAVAAADEGDAALGATLGSDATVYIVRKTEISVVVRDVAKGLHVPNLIAGAKVKVTSRFNGQAVEGTTNADGAATFDIAALAEDEGKKRRPASYGFNAVIEVEAEGYRLFRSGIYRVEGGSALAIPTQPTDDGIPYPSTISFDEWDALYTYDDATDFVQSSANDINHSLAVTLEGCPANAAVAAALFVDGSQYATASGSSDANGHAAIDLSETFLLSSSAQALPVGDDHEYALRYKIGSTTYEVPVQLTVSEAPPEAQSALNKDLELSPFPDKTDLAISFPEGFPVVGGQKVKLWKPSFPIDVAFDPFGYARVSATTPAWGYIRDNGQPDPNGWKFHPRKSGREQYDKAKQGMADMAETALTSLVSKDGAIKQISFASRLYITANLELAAATTWSWEGKESRGRAQAAICVAAGYSLMETFWAGVIPIVIRFSIGLSVKAAAEMGIVTPSILTPSKYRWDYTSTGFDLQICFPPMLSVGVGVGGICSLSLKGTFTLTFYLHCGPVPDGYESLPNPHIRVAALASASVELEFLFYSHSWKLWDSDWDDFYDNWKANTLQSPAPFVSELAGKTQADIFNSATIIPESALAQVAEFSTQGAASLNAHPVLTAGAAQLMVANGTDEPESTDGGVSRWVGETGTADAVGEHGYAAIPAAQPGVLRLGLEEGFRTTTDMRVASNILAGSRFKMFSAGDGDYIVRLGAVMVAGHARTRLIAERVGSSERRVIDFQTSDNRDDCFDYDFDISTTHVNGEEVVNLVVISGTRPDGDATVVSNAAGQTFFSFLTCRNWAGAGTFTGLTLNARSLQAAGASENDFPYRNYSCPQLRQIVSTVGGVEYGQAVVTFLERAARFEDQLMGDDAALTRTGVGLVFFSDADQTVYVSGMDALRAVVTREIIDPSITEVTLSEQAGGWHVLMLKGNDKTHYVLLQTEACVRVIGGKPVPLLLTAQLANLGAYEGMVARLISLPTQGSFLACVDGKLKIAEVVAGEGGAALTFTDVEGEDINIDDFGVTGSGDVLFWPAKREAGGGYVFGEDGEPVASDNPEVNVIMGARIRGGRISRSMTLSEVGHPMNRIRAFEQSGSYLSFISSNTLDAATGQAELWYTAVPWVRCATLASVEPYEKTLAVGDELPFFVAIRNDGNCYLSGVTLSVAEKGGAEIGTMRLDFAEENTLESQWNPRGEDGALTNVEDDWALAPGATSLYWAEYVTIPESWAGEKQIEVNVIEVRSSGTSLLRASADGAAPEDVAIDYLPETGAEATLKVAADDLNAGDQGAYTPANITVIEDGGGQGGGQGGGSQGGGGQGGGSGSQGGGSQGGGGQGGSSGSARGGGSTPNTGDDSASAMAAGLALGGAAAAFAAYSARRSQLERETE